MSNTSKSGREIKMYSLVKKWQSSGIQKKEFCRKHNITIHSFNYWIRKIRNQNKASEFIELKPLPEISTSESVSTSVKFTFAGNVSAEVPLDTAVKFMSQLVLN